MFKNYLLVSLRNLLRNRIYSFINIIGLATGITACIFIMLWVADELSYDNFHANANKLYQVYAIQTFGGKVGQSTSVPLPLHQALKNADTNIIKVCATDWGNSPLLGVNGKKFTKRSLNVSEEFLSMFRFPLLMGDAETALSDPYSIVLAESTAKAFFGDADPIGQTVMVDNKHELKVTGILKDLPRNSSFQFDCLTSFDWYEQNTAWVKQSRTRWDNFAFQVYVELNDAANKDAVESNTKGIILKNNPNEDSNPQLFYHPLNRWRLHSQFEHGKESGGRIEYVQMFSLLGFFILIISCINFMNLATARSERRAREVGIRKSVGSTRTDLIAQFLGESLFISMVSFAIALSIVQLTLPFYNYMVEKELMIHYNSPEFWLAAAMLIAITGLLSGSYPAFFLSAFNPAKVLKGKAAQVKGAVTFRQVLVVTQFALSIGLIISTIVIYNQVQFTKGRQLGYDQQNLINVRTNSEVSSNYDVIKQELISNSQVASVTSSFSPLTGIYQNSAVDNWPGKSPDTNVLFAFVGVGYHYTNTVGAKIIQGRDFSEQFKSDSNEVVINQAAMDIMNMENPIGEKINFWNTEYTIIGVVEDMVMESPFKTVRPMILFRQPWVNNVIIRFANTNDLQASIKSTESVFKKHSPSYPFEYSFVDDDFAKKFSNINLIENLFKIFASLTILISCLGLLGLAAFTAEQRTKEIGIRKVLGASVSSIMLLLSKDFSRLVIIAFVIAVPLAWWGLSQWLENYPYRVAIHWWVLAAAGVLSFLLAIATVSSQAMKAAVSNPVDSLRSE
jgi:putative ABC transport system permease protein